jgi:hypothetical protein|tara:strand:- start:1215 stop:1361 length:147 start_codon:yes stop_codon:yes gene_type:complete
MFLMLGRLSWQKKTMFFERKALIVLLALSRVISGFGLAQKLGHSQASS